MSSTALIAALKSELKTAGITYAHLARELGLAESSVKRIFAQADMPLSRIDDICRVLHIDFSDLARLVADAQPLRSELTLAQEKAVIADRRLLLVATCCLSQWSYAQILATYQLTEAECIRCLTQLDKLGIIKLKPLNRYQLQLSKTFRWRPNGPVMSFFRDEVAPEYFSGAFDRDDELMLLVHGSLAPEHARQLVERLQRTAETFSRHHADDVRLPSNRQQSYTMLIGLRSWWYQAFADLRRPSH